MTDLLTGHRITSDVTTLVGVTRMVSTRWEQKNRHYQWQRSWMVFFCATLYVAIVFYRKLLTWAKISWGHLKTTESVNSQSALLICYCSCCLGLQVTTLDAVPDIEMLVYLPEILDGLLIILGDQNQEIRQMWVMPNNISILPPRRLCFQQSLFVCLFVRRIIEKTWPIFTKFCGSGSWKKLLNFGCNQLL